MATTNKERLQQNNLELVACIGLANTGGGPGSKECVLGELLVTENGVYDEPVLEEELIIARPTADGTGFEMVMNVGEYITCKKQLTVSSELHDHITSDGGSRLDLYNYNDPDNTNWRCGIECLYDGDDIGFWFTMSKATSDNSYVYYDYFDQIGAKVAGADFGIAQAGWYIDEGNGSIKLDTPPSFPFGGQDSDADWMWLTSCAKDFFVGPTTPADGWNKVTVNVAGEAIIKPLMVKKNGVYSAKTGGVLEYDKEVKFKDVITEADFEAYIANAEVVESRDGENLYHLDNNFDIMHMFLPDAPPVYAIMNYATDTGYVLNGFVMNESMSDGWQSMRYGTPMDAPTTTISSDAQMSADLTTTAVFFDVEPVDAYCPVFVDVAANVVPLDVTENGTYEPEGGTDGYSTITVNVPSKPEQTKKVTITANGTTDVLPDDGYTMSKVTVTVKQSSVNMNGTTKVGDISDNASFALVNNDLHIFGSGYVNKTVYDQCKSFTSQVKRIYIDPRITAISDGIGRNRFGAVMETHISDLSSWCKLSISNTNYLPSYYAPLYLNGTQITDLIIPDGVDSIAPRVFANTTYETSKKFNSIVIPDSITSVGEDAFKGGKATNVYMPSLDKWCAIDFSGDNANPTKYCDNVYINNVLMDNNSNIIIPEGCTKIGNYFFNSSYGYGAKTGLHRATGTLEIPDSVETIGDKAFYNSCFTTIKIGKGVKRFGQQAFDMCTMYTSNKRTVYGPDINTWCNIENPSGTSPCVAFYSPNPGEVGNVSAAVDFYLDGVLVTGQLVIPDNVQTLGNFAGCPNITSVTSTGATKIGQNAFANCPTLSTVHAPAVITVESYAFINSNALTTADLSAETIDVGAFQGCGSLITLILRSNTVCSLAKNALLSNYHFTGEKHSIINPQGLKDGYIYVPAALVDSYKTAANWSTYASQFRAIEDYPEICG